MILAPPEDGRHVEVIRGPNIAPLPVSEPLPDTLSCEVILKTGDNITTDDIMPAGKYLPLRSNVPEYAKHVFEGIDEHFYNRAVEAKKNGGGIIVGGENYGQGSSREHAALCPMFLGVKAVMAKSFARIHLANLMNFGILALTFKHPDDYHKIEQWDRVDIDLTGLARNTLVVRNASKAMEIPVLHSLVGEELDVVKAGGKLAYVKRRFS